MTPQEKAKELIKIYYLKINGIAEDSISFNQSKQCAIIAVEEIEKAIPLTIPHKGYGSALFKNPDIDFWYKVKQEINNL